MIDSPENGAAARRPLRILVVDDDATERRIAEVVLRRAGHDVVLAGDGEEALAVFERAAPDIAVLDIFMPKIDGYDVAALLKRKSAGAFLPIIFLTGQTDSKILAHCVTSGGDDFLSKPFEPTILLAKITAFGRIRELHAEVLRRNEIIARQQAHLGIEMQAAERIMRRITKGDALESPCLRYAISPCSLFNGDLLLGARTPDGALHLLLADFMGHGLPAAIGAIPAAEVFYAMSERGRGIDEIALELNRKLRRCLGAGMFAAAALVRIEAARRLGEVWNGGLPDILVARDGGIVHRFESRHTMLGVVDADRGYGATEGLVIASTERLLLYTDGVTEARAPTGEMYSEARLVQAVEKADPDGVFAAILAELVAWKCGAENDDDTTLIEVDCGREMGAPAPHLVAMDSLPSGWRLAFDLDAAGIRDVRLPEMLGDALAGIGVHGAPRLALLSVVSELYGNALDHGILELDSALKDGVDGFAAYYELRERRLAALEHAAIRVEIACVPGGERPELVVVVEDSGRGFDWRADRECASGAAATTHGRGLAIARSLCSALRHEGNGNRVTAILRPFYPPAAAEAEAAADARKATTPLTPAGV